MADSPKVGDLVIVHVKTPNHPWGYLGEVVRIFTGDLSIWVAPLKSERLTKYCEYDVVTGKSFTSAGTAYTLVFTSKLSTRKRQVLFRLWKMSQN